MTIQEREVLQRVRGTLEGILVSGDVSEGIAETLITTVERLDSILDGSCKNEGKQ